MDKLTNSFFQMKIFALILLILSFPCGCKHESKKIETQTLDNESAAAAKVVTEFYAWYRQAIVSDSADLCQPKFKKGENGMATLDFSRYTEQLRLHHFHEDLIQKSVKSFQPCLENLKTIPYDTLIAFTELDQFEEINCDYGNGHQWFGGAMDYPTGAEVAGVLKKSETELILTVKLYDQSNLGPREYGHWWDFKVAMLRDSSGWKIAGFEFKN